MDGLHWQKCFPKEPSLITRTDLLQKCQSIHWTRLARGPTEASVAGPCGPLSETKLGNRNIMEWLLDHRPQCPADRGPNSALPLKRTAGYLRTLSAPQCRHLQSSDREECGVPVVVMKETYIKCLYIHGEGGRGALPPPLFRSLLGKH